MVKDLPIHVCADSRKMIRQAVYHRNDPNPFPISATEMRYTYINIVCFGLT